MLAFHHFLNSLSLHMVAVNVAQQQNGPENPDPLHLPPPREIVTKLSAGSCLGKNSSACVDVCKCFKENDNAIFACISKTDPSCKFQFCFSPYIDSTVKASATVLESGRAAHNHAVTTIETPSFVSLKVQDWDEQKQYYDVRIDAADAPEFWCVIRISLECDKENIKSIEQEESGTKAQKHPPVNLTLTEKRNETTVTKTRTRTRTDSALSDEHSMQRPKTKNKKQKQ